MNEAANVSTPNAEERNWAVGCHLAALSGLITGIGFILGPLIVWLVKKDESAFVSDLGKHRFIRSVQLFSDETD